MLTRIIFLGCSCCFLAIPSAANGEPSPALPVRVTVCELASHPDAYDRKLVEVQGRIYFGKFDFVIDARCEPRSHRKVWLDLGGDTVSPAQYWDIGSFLPKRRGMDVQVKGIAVPLVPDDLTNRFVNDVGATRFRMPNGDECGSECLFYEVNATVRGMFFSGLKGGFGMNRCCHLLVVEKVTSLSSRRTSVPAGGTCQCASDHWQPLPEELKALSEIPACSLGEDFKNCFPIIARHWGDSIIASNGIGNRGWISPDMTLYYKFEGGFISKAAPPSDGKSPAMPVWKSELKPSSSFTREICRPISPAYPAADHIYCSFYRSYQPEERDAVMALQGKVDAGEEAWRTWDMARVAWLAFDRARKAWSLEAVTQAKLSKCEAWPPGKDGGGNQQEGGYCTWYTPDDMQEITVELQKPGYLTKPSRELKTAVWVPISVEANLCKAAPSQ